MQTVPAVARKILVATVAGQRDRHLGAGQLAYTVGRQGGAVGKRFVVDRSQRVEKGVIIGADPLLEMLRMQMVGDLPRIDGFIEACMVETDGTGAHRLR